MGLFDGVVQDEPKEIDANVTPHELAAIRKRCMTSLLDNGRDLARRARLPWCSIATLEAKGEQLNHVAEPAIS
jgi:hypothetical protein